MMLYGSCAELSRPELSRPDLCFPGLLVMKSCTSLEFEALLHFFYSDERWRSHRRVLLQHQIVLPPIRDHDHISHSSFTELPVG